MTCTEARSALLTADLHEVRGEGDSELARHVRACAECATAAQKILRVTSALSQRLERAVVPAPKKTRVSAWPAWIALPIAAAIATVLIVRDPNGMTPSPEAAALRTVKQPVARTVVNAPRDRNVAVFEATNKITVVWDLGAKGGS